jgi:hypothetical protein
MRGVAFIAGLIIAASLSAVVASVQQRHREVSRCSLDGSLIDPVYEVEVIQGDQSARMFCCILNAQIWLERNGSAVSAVWVTDETTGHKIRAEEAYYVASTIVTTPHTGERIHAFSQKADAQLHARQFDGKLISNPVGFAQKTPVKLATYRPDSPNPTGTGMPSTQTLFCLASDTVLIKNLNDVGLRQRCSSRLSKGYSNPPDKPPNNFF